MDSHLGSLKLSELHWIGEIPTGVRARLGVGVELGSGLVQFEERRTQRLATHLVLAAARFCTLLSGVEPGPSEGSDADLADRAIRAVP